MPQHLDSIIRVLLADDSAVILKAVRMLLEEDSEICVVGQVTCKANLFPSLQETKADVLILDLHMCPERGVLSALKDIPLLEVLLMSALVGRESMELAARLGVKEVLEKTDLPNTLAKAIKSAYAQRHSNARAAIAS